MLIIIHNTFYISLRFGMRKWYKPVPHLLQKLVESCLGKRQTNWVQSHLYFHWALNTSEPQLDLVHTELVGLLQKANVTTMDQDSGMKG